MFTRLIWLWLRLCGFVGRDLVLRRLQRLGEPPQVKGPAPL